MSDLEGSRAAAAVTETMSPEPGTKRREEAEVGEETGEKVGVRRRKTKEVCGWKRCAALAHVGDSNILIYCSLHSIFVGA